MPTTEPVIVPFEGQSKDLEGDIKRLNGEFDKFASHTKTASATASQSGKTATMSWTDFRSMYSTVLDVVRVGQQVWQATGQEFVNYAEQVKNMSRSLGASAEETSRLIQVADDVRVSYDTMKIAMKEAQKDGVQPNIDGLAKLSDQYLALKPGVERTKFLLDKFGKSGLEMGKLMEMGGDGIRKASDAISENLIMTDKGIKASDDYQASLDTLKDSAYGVQVAFGSKLTPVLNSFMRIVLADIEAVGVFKEVLSGNKSLTEAAKEVAGIINDNGFEVFGLQVGKVKDEIKELTPELEGNADGLDTQKEAVKAAEQALKDYQSQLEAVSQANLDMESMSRTIANDQKQYAEDHAAAIDKVKEAQFELNQALGNFGGGKKKLSDIEWEKLYNNVAEAQADVQGLEATWHESAQNMIYDMILVGLSAGGLLDSEQKALDEYAVKAGIKTQADIDEANRRREIADATIAGILQSEDVLAEQRKVDAETLRLQTEITSQEKLTAANNEAQAIANVTAHTRQEITEQARLAASAMRTAAAYNSIPHSSGGTSGSGGSGGNVPMRDSGGAGIAGQPYMITPKASPEIFVPKTNGTFIPNADKALGGVTYNIIINNPVGQPAENDIRKALRMGNATGRFA